MTTTRCENSATPGPASAAAQAAATAAGGARRQCARRSYRFEASKERRACAVRQRLDAVRREIDARYFVHLDIRDLADTARMSRHHFIRVFGDLFGMSPYRYLLRVRVRAAKRLLRCSREPIDVIAAGVGFRSGPSLNRAFKQAEGASISAYCRAAARGAALRT